MLKVGKKVRIAVWKKQGKKYHNFTNNVNFVNFNALNCWSCSADLLDILQAMFQMICFSDLNFQISAEVSSEVACVTS